MIAPQDKDDNEAVNERLTKLEQDFSKLAQISANNALGLDKLSRAVELQTQTLGKLLETAENQNDLLEGVASSIKQLNIINEETKPLFLSTPDEDNEDD